MSFLRLILLGLLFSLAYSSANARQNPHFPTPEVPLDTIRYAFVPVISYTSDLGIIGGGLVQRFDYTPGYYPYRNSIRVQALGSTKGMVDILTRFEQTETFGRDIRSFWEIGVFRLFDDNYFGLGNNSPFMSDLWNDGFYNYESRAATFFYRGRYPLFMGAERQRLDASFLINISYFTPFVDDDAPLLITLDRPPGYEGGFVNLLGFGVQWENRDSEFAPTRGNTLRLETKLAHEWLFSDFRFATLELSGSHYVSIPFLFHSVLAFHSGGILSLGDPPFFRMAELGGQYRLRGFPLYRFRDYHALWYSTELRNWIYHNPFYDFKVGVHAFTDGGRVFSSSERFGWDGFHQTFGGGTAMQLFTPDFILRIEYARSPEAGRIYMGVGYMF